MTWNPAQYERFRNERRQPFVDLLALIERRTDMRVLDLGCGTGELTRDLHEELGARETLGMDSSAEMLRKSDSLRSGSLAFTRGEIETFHPDGAWDLVFSNAALHWVADHERVLARLAGFLSSEGQIAIQMPANDEHASHLTAAAVARRFGIEPRHDPVLAPERYAILLHELDFERQIVRVQIYGHELAAARDVVEWVKGSLLTEYEKRLSASDYMRFLQEYERDLIEEIGESRPYFYTYKRIFIWASARSATSARNTSGRSGVY